VQRADDLTAASWLLIATNLPGTGGIIQLTDTNAAGQARKFYRVRVSP
jgi:hypothetical protein